MLDRRLHMVCRLGEFLRPSALVHSKVPHSIQRHLGLEAEMGEGRERSRRAAGTRTPWDVFKAAFRSPKESASLADIQAIEHGEGRTVACWFRGLYGQYPRRFVQRKLDLVPGGMLFQPYWFSASHRNLRVEDAIISAHVRPRDPRTDWNIKSSGQFRRGGLLESSGFSVIVCETLKGPLELAVPNPDLDLVLKYLHRAGGLAASGDE